MGNLGMGDLGMGKEVRLEMHLGFHWSEAELHRRRSRLQHTTAHTAVAALILGLWARWEWKCMAGWVQNLVGQAASAGFALMLAPANVAIVRAVVLARNWGLGDSTTSVRPAI
jgi:hypothetical protein